MDDVADEETDSETHRKELRIFKIKRDIKRDTEIKEATSDVGDDDSPQIEDRTSVREIAQYFGALHEPLFAAKIRSTDDDNSRCTAQFSGQTEDLVLKSKTISTSVTSFDSTQLSTNTSTDRCEFPPSMGAQISKSTVPPDHHPNEDARQDSYRLPEAYNHIVQFITHSSVSKLRNITDGGGTTIDRNHQTTIPDADSTKESVSSPGLTEASDSCALIGSVQTDIDSDTSMTGGDGDETEEVNKQAVTQKAVIADISAPIPSRYIHLYAHI
uniref:Uncharacterized protein n=1 Tax=Parascaris equorum TaxID=6256 RepID=A0A914RZA1_PAREQ